MSKKSPGGFKAHAGRTSNKGPVFLNLDISASENVWFLLKTKKWEQCRNIPWKAANFKDEDNSAAVYTCWWLPDGAQSLSTDCDWTNIILKFYYCVRKRYQFLGSCDFFSYVIECLCKFCGIVREVGHLGTPGPPRALNTHVVSYPETTRYRGFYW